jgi:hypothetical protein
MPSGQQRAACGYDAANSPGAHFHSWGRWRDKSILAHHGSTLECLQSEGDQIALFKVLGFPEFIECVAQDVDGAAKMIAQPHPGKKRLVFVDSRRGVEALGEKLRAIGVDAYVTHSSLSLEDRQAAEAAFQDGQNCVIIATSVLELGCLSNRSAAAFTISINRVRGVCRGP